MKNFERLQDLIVYLDNKSHEKDFSSSIIYNYGPENLLFAASHEMKISGENLYGFHIQRITLFPLKQINMIVAFHIFIPSQPELINRMIADIGNYEIEASWGIGDNLSETKIFDWKYKHHNVILKKKIRSIRDYELLPPLDVITVSTDLYENSKGSGYWEK